MAVLSADYMGIPLDEINFLYHLLEQGEITHNEVIDWAFTQYDGGTAEKWIEEVSIAYSKSEMIDILRSNFNVTGTLNQEKEIGQIAYVYFHKENDIKSAVRKLYDVICMSNEGHKNKADIYYVDDLFDWRDNPVEETTEIVEPILKEYMPRYECLRSKFFV